MSDMLFIVSYLSIVRKPWCTFDMSAMWIEEWSAKSEGAWASFEDMLMHEGITTEISYWRCLS